MLLSCCVFVPSPLFSLGQLAPQKSAASRPAPGVPQRCLVNPIQTLCLDTASLLIRWSPLPLVFVCVFLFAGGFPYASPLAGWRAFRVPRDVRFSSFLLLKREWSTLSCVRAILEYEEPAIATPRLSGPDPRRLLLLTPAGRLHCVLLRLTCLLPPFAPVYPRELQFELFGFVFLRAV